MCNGYCSLITWLLVEQRRDRSYVFPDPEPQETRTHDPAAMGRQSELGLYPQCIYISGVSISYTCSCLGLRVRAGVLAIFRDYSVHHIGVGTDMDYIFLYICVLCVLFVCNAPMGPTIIN